MPKLIAIARLFSSVALGYSQEDCPETYFINIWLERADGNAVPLHELVY